MNYDPIEPSREDVERLLITKNSKLLAEPKEIIVKVKRYYTIVKILKINISLSREIAVIREGYWPIVVIYYVCLLKRNIAWLKENTPYSKIEIECY